MQNQPSEVRLPKKEGISVESSSYVDGQFGVITTREFKKGEVLFTVGGPILTEPTKYSFAAGMNQHIVPQEEDGASGFGHYLNHSCDPNVIVRPVHNDGPVRIDVIARHDIKSGEELAFDYASLEYDVTIANSTCLCGTKKCRSVIHGFKDMSDEVKELYKTEGLIAEYLLNLSDQK